MIVTITLAILMIGHELGHIYVARRYGVPVYRIRIGAGPVLARLPIRGILYELHLVPFGMYAGYPRAAIRTHTQDAWIAAGGLIATVALSLVAMALSFPVRQPEMFLAGVVFLPWGLIGILPLPGLDGVHIWGKLKTV